MSELALIDMIKNVIKALLSSKCLILAILELFILAIYLIYSRIMNKRVVKYSSIVASLLIFGFYISNYVTTMKTFVDNVATRIVELIYFPTTLEFSIVLVLSIMIMAFTYRNKGHKVLKVVNTAIPFTIALLFIGVIEYISNNNIEFDEFSIFTNPTLMSLNEIAMAIFAAWIVGLIIYKVDLFIINKVTSESINDNIVEQVIEIPFENIEDDFIEMPRLKTEM